MIRNRKQLATVYENQYKLLKRLSYSEKDLEFHASGSFSPILDHDDWSFEIYSSNYHYGTSTAIKRYCSIPETCALKVGMPHGVYLGDEKFICSELDWYVPVFLTWGTWLADVWRKRTNKPIFAVGPAFCYADSLFSERYVSEEKKRLGKNLLVFPAHSHAWADSEYAVGALIDRIASFKSRFDSIRVCMYWKDIEKGTHHQYRDKGLECVTAGHVGDPSFLPRLKGLFKICDAALTNTIGSQIGYSVSMEKPIVWLEDDIKTVNIRTDSADAARTEAYENDPGYLKLKKLLTQNDFVITEEIREAIEPYWGLKEVKTKEELRSILLHAEELWQMENGPTSLQSSVASVPGKIVRFAWRRSKKILKPFIPAPLASVVRRVLRKNAPSTTDSMMAVKSIVRNPPDELR